MRLLLIVAAFILVVTLVLRATPARAAEPPLRSTLQLDLGRYMGRWWVIGHVPYFAERGKVATADVYALRPDGRISNTYVYRKAFGEAEKSMHGVATVVPGTGNAQWRIAFFGGLVKADYLVLEVSPDYQWALIGEPRRKLAWIFSRDPVVDDARFAELRGRFAAYGYDTQRIVRVPQRSEQLPVR